MSKHIVFEGWLTKSPPNRRIWKTKWRRRWFALRQSMDLPGQYFLDYFSDCNRIKPKGSINLELCEQVDAGLHMERGNGSLDPKIRGSVFTIQTQSRTYHLEADSEAEMERWVDAICKVCGLRATNEPSCGEVNIRSMSATNQQYECPDRTGRVYIPISECITGERRSQSSQRAFTFDTKNIVTSGRRAFERAPDRRSLCISQPHIRVNAEFSENESNLSDEDSKSLNNSQSNIRDWSVTKSFKKLAVNPNKAVSDEPPEPPPRPPKTLTMGRDKESFQGPKIQEPTETKRSRTPQRFSLAPPSPRFNAARSADEDDDDISPGHPSLQYFNLASLPPAVDRALKPRPSSHINHLTGQTNPYGQEEVKADVLLYLDLDLHTPEHQKKTGAIRKISHGKSHSDLDTDSAYKTVDFVKTEAFNITRQDAEASRNLHMH